VKPEKWKGGESEEGRERGETPLIFERWLCPLIWYNVRRDYNLIASDGVPLLGNRLHADSKTLNNELLDRADNKLVCHSL